MIPPVNQKFNRWIYLLMHSEFEFTNSHPTGQRLLRLRRRPPAGGTCGKAGHLWRKQMVVLACLTARFISDLVSLKEHVQIPMVFGPKRYQNMHGLLRCYFHKWESKVSVSAILQLSLPGVHQKSKQLRYNIRSIFWGLTSMQEFWKKKIMHI